MKSRLAIALAIALGLLFAAWLYHGYVQIQFFNAVSAGDLLGARRWVDMWPGLVNSTDERGMAALHEALAQGDVDMVVLLIKYDAKVNQPALYRGLPLHIAAGRCSKPEMMRILLDAGVDVDGRSPYATGSGETALHQASGARCLANMQLLMEHGADPNARDQGGYTPLHDAVLAAGEDDDERMEAITMLLNAGADVNAKNKRGETPLSSMDPKHPRGKRERMREFLLSHGAIP